MESNLKECSVCGETKVLEEFYRNKNRTDGRDNRCKECERIRFGSKKRTEKWNNNRLDSAIPDGWRRLEDVINGQKSILVECENGHQSRRRPSDLVSKKQSCLQCIEEGYTDRKKRWTNEYLDTELAKKKPGWRRIGDVIMVKDTVKLLCDKGHENNKAPHDIFRTGCPICSNKEKWNDSRLDDILPKGWKRLGNVGNVKGSHEPVELKCDKGHIFKVAPHNLINGVSCVECNARHAIDYGKLFERMVDELLIELNIYYKKGYNKKIKPDYVFKNNIWADAKLSRWTITQPSCETVEKYEPYCTLLNIIYLRGEVLDKMITKKTRLISVHLLIKQLPKHLQRVYSERCNEIEELTSNNLTA